MFPSLRCRSQPISLPFLHIVSSPRLLTEQTELTPAVVTQIRKMGIQLYQLSSGNDGQTLGNGVHVNSTPEAMQEELRTTWIQMRGPQGEEFRKNTIRVRGLMRKSYEEGGTREAMLSLSQYFTDKE